jgi:hypothetical protein
VLPPLQQTSPESSAYTSSPSTTTLLSSSIEQRDYRTMDEIAWDVLQTVHGIDPTMFLYHSFSNGGCFLWESICRILEYRHDADVDEKQQQYCKTIGEMGNKIQSLSSKCRGVIYDSSPAWFGSPPLQVMASIETLFRCRKTRYRNTLWFQSTDIKST